MRRILVAVTALTVAASVSASAQESPLEQLAWLSGCWAAASGEAGSGEHWLPLAGGTLLGIARTVRHGKTVEHEFLQIRVNAEGKVGAASNLKCNSPPT